MYVCLYFQSRYVTKDGLVWSIVIGLVKSVGALPFWECGPASSSASLLRASNIHWGLPGFVRNGFRSLHWLIITLESPQQFHVAKHGPACGSPPRAATEGFPWRALACASQDRRNLVQNRFCMILHGHCKCLVLSLHIRSPFHSYTASVHHTEQATSISPALFRILYIPETSTYV